MTSEASIEQLLRWRLARAEAEALPAPSAARLLEMARPWWERWPERFQARVARLATLQVAYGYAMETPYRDRSGHAVPALVAQATGEDLESAARILYLSVRGGRLRLRFELDPEPGESPALYQVTFVAEGAVGPLLSAQAVASAEGELRLEAELPADLVATWESLKVTDEMPFRLILHPAT